MWSDIRTMSMNYDCDISIVRYMVRVQMLQLVTSPLLMPFIPMPFRPMPLYCQCYSPDSCTTCETSTGGLSVCLPINSFLYTSICIYVYYTYNFSICIYVCHTCNSVSLTSREV